MKVGDIVYVIPIGVNNTRYIKDSIVNHIQEYIVESIGKKYFYLKNLKGQKLDKKFSLENLKDVIPHYSSDWQVYTDKQQIFDEVEYDNLYSFIRSKFDSCTSKNVCTLEQLREIVSILKK